MPVSNWKDIRSFPVPFRAVYNAVIQPKISVMHKPSHCNVVKLGARLRWRKVSVRVCVRSAL